MIKGGISEPSIEEYESIFNEINVPVVMHEDIDLDISPEDRPRLFFVAMDVEEIVNEKGPVFSADTLCRIGNFEYISGNTEKAEKYYDMAVDIEPENPYGWASRGFLLFMEKRDLQGAKKCCIKAIGCCPEMVDALGTLGYISALEGDIKEAKKYVKKGIDIESDNPRLKALEAYIHCLNGKLKKAARTLMKVIHGNKKLILPHLVMGEVLRRMERHEAAMMEYVLIEKLIQ